MPWRRNFGRIRSPPVRRLAASVRAQVDRSWPVDRLEAAGRHFVERQHHVGDARLRATASSAAVICAKSLRRRISRSGGGELRIDLDFLPSAAAGWLSLPGRTSTATRVSRRRAAFPPAAPARAIGENICEHLLDEFARVPEEPERLVEHRMILVPRHEHAMQRPVEIVAARNARRLRRLHRIDHRCRANPHAGPAQRAGEIEDVVGQPAVRIRLLALPGRASSSPSGALGSPCAHPPSPRPAASCLRCFRCGRCRPGI